MFYEYSKIYLLAASFRG